jgi:hypothetical protein
MLIGQNFQILFICYFFPISFIKAGAYELGSGKTMSGLFNSSYFYAGTPYSFDVLYENQASLQNFGVII